MAYIINNYEIVSGSVDSFPSGDIGPNDQNKYIIYAHFEGTPLTTIELTFGENSTRAIQLGQTGILELAFDELSPVTKFKFTAGLSLAYYTYISAIYNTVLE